MQTGHPYQHAHPVVCVVVMLVCLHTSQVWSCGEGLLDRFGSGRQLCEGLPQEGLSEGETGKAGGGNTGYVRQPDRFDWCVGNQTGMTGV